MSDESVRQSPWELKVGPPPEAWDVWLELTRSAPGPHGLRRPLWLNRPLRPTESAYRL